MAGKARCKGGQKGGHERSGKQPSGRNHKEP
jgi:hypothetical protein